MLEYQSHAEYHQIDEGDDTINDMQGDEGSILALRNLRRSLEAPPLRVITR